MTRHINTEAVLAPVANRPIAAPPKSLSDLGSAPFPIMEAVQSRRSTGKQLRCPQDLFDTHAPATEQIRLALRILTRIERTLFSEQVSDEVAAAHVSAQRPGRPKVMTAERETVAAQMLAKGKRSESVLSLLRALDGPPISLSAYYSWQKAWLAGGKSSGSSRTVQLG